MGEMPTGLIAALSVLEDRPVQDVLTDILQEIPANPGPPDAASNGNGAVTGSVSAERP